MSSVATASNPCLWSCSNEEYHADSDYVSHSALEDFKDSIPGYYGLHIKKNLERGDATDALAMGTALHGWLLEPDAIAERFVTLTPGDGRTKVIKEAREAEMALAKSTNRMTIKKDLWVDAQRMAESALKHPRVKEIVDLQGYCEQSVRVECPVNGKLKARFDKIMPKGHIIEIKTTRNVRPEVFERDVYNMGYHRQAAFYEQVRDLAFGPGEGAFFYVVICSEEPFETVVFEMEPAAREVGRVENMLLLAELNDRRKRNDWSSRWPAVQRLSLPEWVYRKNPTV